MSVLMLVLIGTATGDMDVVDTSVDETVKNVSEDNGRASFLVGFEFQDDGSAPFETDIELNLSNEADGWTHDLDGPRHRHVDSNGWIYVKVNVTAPGDAERGEEFVIQLFMDNSNGTNPAAVEFTAMRADPELSFHINEIDTSKTITPGDGETMTGFSFGVVNDGEGADEYRVEVIGYSTNKFKSIPDQQIDELDPDQSHTVMINVSYATGKQAKDIEAGVGTFTVRITSETNSSLQERFNLTLTIEPFERIYLSTPLAVKDVEADEDNKFEVKLTNTGNTDEKVDVSLVEMDPYHEDWVSFYTDQALTNEITSNVTVPYDETVTVYMKVYFTRDQALSEPDFVPEDSNSNRIQIEVKGQVPTGDNEEQQFTARLNRIVSYEVEIPSNQKTFSYPEKGESVDFDIKVRNTGIEPEDYQLIINDVPQYLKAEFEGGGSVITINDLETTETETLTVEIDTYDIFNLPVDEDYRINVSVRPVHGPSGADVPKDARKQWFDLTVKMDPKGDPKFDITGEEAQEVYPGKNVTYSLRFTNEGNDVDDLTVSITSPEELYGKIKGQTQVRIKNIEPGDSVTLSYAVNISRADAEDRDYDHIDETITVYSSIGDQPSESKTITTTIKEIPYGVEVVFTGKSDDGDPGDELTFAFTVENTGDEDDDIEVRVQESEDPGNNTNPGEIGWLQLTGNNKTATSTLVLDSLEPKKLVPMELIITIPADYKQAEAGVYSYNVSVKSTNDATTIVSNEVRVEVNEKFDLDLTVTPSSGIRQLDPTGTDGDEKIDYTIRLKNEGNTEDQITISTESLPSDLKATIDGKSQYNSPELDPDESSSVTLEVEGASNYDEGTYTFTVLARGSGGAEERVDLTVKLLKGDLRINEIDVENEDSLEEGDNTTITVTLENRGDSEISDLDVILEINGTEIETRTETISENDTVSVSFDWLNINKGSQKIVITTEDPSGEFDEDKTLTVTVAEKDKGGDGKNGDTNVPTDVASEDDGIYLMTLGSMLVLIVILLANVIMLQRRSKGD